VAAPEGNAMADQSTIGDREEAAAYVAELSRDLVIARRHGLDVLGYLLEMARLEAENVTAT
jgi:hypothetical protein